MVNLDDAGDTIVRPNRRMETIKQFYATVLSQTFSSDGQYLVATLKNGKLALFGLNKIFNSHNVNSPADKTIYQTSSSFQAHKEPIQGLTKNRNFLFTGGKGYIKCWKWSTLINQDSTEPVWTIIASHDEHISRPKVNSLLLVGTDDQEETLLAGCGHDKIYGYDLESNTLKYTLDGHSGPVNCMTYSKAKNMLFSGSEDGSVRLWDLRTCKIVNSIEPFRYSELNRPFGKGINTVNLDGSSEWMICGGGPHLSSWHLRSLSRGVIYGDSSFSLISGTSKIHHDLVVSAGNSPIVTTWTLNGKIFSELPCAPFHIHSIAIHEKEDKTLLAVAGASYKINICTNFKYNDFHLEVS